MENKLYRITLAPVECGLDLGDGSERAEYVNQDYILNKLGRPHRYVEIMYTYYPNDEQWPQRISKACADMEVSYQWDYPYDDYEPYGGGIGGSTDGEPFASMRDIRRHGQDVALTLTIDCSVSDEHLRQIARELKPFGRMRLRINHECVGDWFTHNRRFSYKQVGEFFTRFANIIKEEAPNIDTVFCAGFLDPETGKVEREEEFSEAYKTADVWSADCYLALHFSWPYDVAEKGGSGYNFSSVDYYYDRYKRTAERLKELNGGVMKPLTIAEFNVDGDVCGPLHQGDAVLRFARKFRDEKAEWFDGISMYQFRDRGRLGLEMQDPNNSSVGIEQPLLKDYKELLRDQYFSPKIIAGERAELPVRLRWGGSEDAEGAAIPVHFDSSPEFCEITFNEPLCLMLELNGRWFFKAPEVKTVDLMPAFFDNPLKGAADLSINIFATPAEGTNENTDNIDGRMNYYAALTEMPALRIRYEALETIL